MFDRLITGCTGQLTDFLEFSGWTEWQFRFWEI